MCPTPRSSYLHDRRSLYAGDSEAALTGTGSEKVTSVSLGSLGLRPGAIVRADGTDRLTLTAADPEKVAALDPGHRETATVTLADGRKRPLPVVVAAPRPAATLLGLTATPGAAGPQLPIAVAAGKENGRSS